MDRRRIQPRNEFWLYVHELATAYENEGTAFADRADAIRQWFLQMPFAVREQLLTDLDLIASHLPRLREVVVAAPSSEPSTRPELPRHRASGAPIKETPILSLQRTHS